MRVIPQLRSNSMHQSATPHLRRPRNQLLHQRVDERRQRALLVAEEIALARAGRYVCDEDVGVGGQGAEGGEFLDGEVQEEFGGCVSVHLAGRPPSMRKGRRVRGGRGMRNEEWNLPIAHVRDLLVAEDVEQCARVLGFPDAGDEVYI